MFKTVSVTTERISQDQFNIEGLRGKELVAFLDKVGERTNLSQKQLDLFNDAVFCQNQDNDVDSALFLRYIIDIDNNKASIGGASATYNEDGGFTCSSIEGCNCYYCQCSRMSVNIPELLADTDSTEELDALIREVDVIDHESNDEAWCEDMGFNAGRFADPFYANLNK